MRNIIITIIGIGLAIILINISNDFSKEIQQKNIAEQQNYYQQENP
jgi:type II secretory pathway pseudopilin PulG